MCQQTRAQLFFLSRVLILWLLLLRLRLTVVGVAHEAVIAVEPAIGTVLVVVARNTSRDPTRPQVLIDIWVVAVHAIRELRITERQSDNLIGHVAI